MKKTRINAVYNVFLCVLGVPCGLIESWWGKPHPTFFLILSSVQSLCRVCSLWLNRIRMVSESGKMLDSVFAERLHFTAVEVTGSVAQVGRATAF